MPAKAVRIGKMLLLVGSVGDKLLGLDAKFLLENGGEILGILESHTVSQIAYTDAWVLGDNAACLFHADVADETAYAHSCERAQLII